MIVDGGCQCGKIRFSAEIDNFDAYLCHCRMCQRATGNVSIAFKNLPKRNIDWLSEPSWFKSSPIAHRPYCRDCGTPLGFRFIDGDNIDITVGSFDDASKFIPISNFGIESKLDAWENTAHLPGTRADEWEPTVKRWIQAVGEVPE